QMLAVISQRDAVKAVLYSLKTGQASEVPLEVGALPHSVALDATGQRLAVGVWTNPGPDGAKVPFDVGGRLLLYDLRQRGKPPITAVKQGYYLDAVAFHPRQDQVVIGGGANHEVTLWDLGKPNAAPLSKILGPGRCLWGVGLSKDGRYLGFQD